MTIKMHHDILDDGIVDRYSDYMRVLGCDDNDCWVV